MNEPQAGRVRGLRRTDIERIAAEVSSRARVGFVIAGKNLDQGRLARAVLSQQRVHFAAAQLKVDVVQSSLALEGLRETLQSQHHIRASRSRHNNVQRRRCQAFLKIAW